MRTIYLGELTVILMGALMVLKNLTSYLGKLCTSGTL
jgi:hypothetical protein